MRHRRGPEVAGPDVGAERRSGRDTAIHQLQRDPADRARALGVMAASRRTIFKINVRRAEN